MTFRAVPPEGDADTLLMVPNYGFQWQTAYHHGRPARSDLPRARGWNARPLRQFAVQSVLIPVPNRRYSMGRRRGMEMMNWFVFFRTRRMKSYGS